jgi:hypothetical protein
MNYNFLHPNPLHLEVITMPRGRPKKSDNASKAELIRQTAKSLPKPIRPRDIIAALKEKGVDVSYPQITSALKAGGFHRRRRRNKGVGAASQSPTANGLNLDALLAAKALIAKVGSVEVAEEALRALKKLG